MHTPEQRAAYVNAQVACALIEAMGMMADNLFMERNSDTVEYGKEAFEKLINKYGIHHNAVIGYLREV